MDYWNSTNLKDRYINSRLEANPAGLYRYGTRPRIDFILLTNH